MNMAHMPCGLHLGWGGLWSAGNRLLDASHGTLHGPSIISSHIGGEVGWGAWHPHLLQERLDTVQRVLDILVQLRVAGHLHTMP